MFWRYNNNILVVVLITLLITCCPISCDHDDHVKSELAAAALRIVRVAVPTTVPEVAPTTELPASPIKAPKTLLNEVNVDDFGVKGDGGDDTQITINQNKVIFMDLFNT